MGQCVWLYHEVGSSGTGWLQYIDVFIKVHHMLTIIDDMLIYLLSPPGKLPLLTRIIRVLLLAKPHLFLKSKFCQLPINDFRANKAFMDVGFKPPSNKESVESHTFMNRSDLMGLIHF